MTQQSKTSLRLERTYTAPIDRVRACLTDPALLARWFAPGDMRADVLHADERTGGRYKIAMHGRDPEGNEATHTCTGVYQAVEPRRVVMSFNWSEQPLPSDTTLTFELDEVEDGTRLRLTHEGLPGDEAVQMHTQGWESCLAQLEQALA